MAERPWRVRNGSRLNRHCILHLMDHAAPLPDEPSMASPDSSRHATPPCAKTPRSPTVRTSPRPRDTPNPQARLLQLRNAGFRGSAIAGRRVSPIFTSPCAVPDSLAYPIHDENAPRTAERRTLYGEDLPPNPVNILQEIHNSTRRKRHSPTLGFGEIFQDRTPDENIMGAPSGNSYHNRGSSTCSPSPSNVPRPKMSKLRENHWTKSPPPISPPVAKPPKGRRVSRVNIRSTSLESATYIEHLESQLAAANAKLDSIMSPTTNKTRAAKLRALSNESRSLRQEVSNWETKFEQRVREQIDRRDEIEAGMRSHIQSLEEEMEMKDAKLKELEWELDNTRNKVREMEGLEEINKNLERRIDVLTDLVAQSPTKLDLGSPTSSPTRADPVSRAQRRRSMLPKVQSSPGGVRLSLNTATDSGFWSSKRGGPHSGGLASRDGTNCLLEEEEGPEKATEGRPRESLSSVSSASFPSMPFSFPRPQSIHSISSVEFPSPELPSPSEADSQTKSISRQRRMRRFPSGLCTLKPLILPKATGTPIPASAPVSATSGSSPRHISNGSLDPTIAFLSKIDDRSSVSTPVQRSRQRSATWAQEETLKILERNSKASSLMDDDAAAPSLMSPIEFSQDPDGESETDHPKPIRARPLSLEKELELANMLSPDDLDDAIRPVDAEEDGMLGSSLTVIDDSYSETPLTNPHLLPPTTPSAADITPKARGSNIVVPSPPKSTPVDACRKGITLGIFTRLTSLIHRVKQDPVVLAQRLLCNAWTLGSARLGGAGWWLLGLVFRSHRKERTFPG